MIPIFIPTRGRVDTQLTFSNLPRELQKYVYFVCPSKEATWLGHKGIVWVQPDDQMGISAKRKWIIEKAALTGFDKMVMLDDDLRFAVRREDNPGLFREAKTEDTLRAFDQLATILDADTPHAGFSARGGGISDAAKRGGWQEAKRMMYVLGYHIPTVLANAEFGRMRTHEDMDVCLQLLTKGFPNAVNFSFVVDQKFGNKGGCTNERTVEINNADSLQLAAYFPDFVRATEKVYAGSTNRVEVVCQWQKALAHGLQHRQQR